MWGEHGGRVGKAAVVCGTGYTSVTTGSSSAEPLPCVCDVDRADRGADMSRALRQSPEQAREGLSAQEKNRDRVVTISISCLCAGSSLEHARATMHDLPRGSMPRQRFQSLCLHSRVCRATRPVIPVSFSFAVRFTLHDHFLPTFWL